ALVISGAVHLCGVSATAALRASHPSLRPTPVRVRVAVVPKPPDPVPPPPPAVPETTKIVRPTRTLRPASRTEPPPGPPSPAPLQAPTETPPPADAPLLVEGIGL